MNKVKLSQRVRPNTEAAAWVVDEIVLLEQRIAELQSQLDAVRQISADEVAGRIVSSEAVERIQQALQEQKP